MRVNVEDELRSSGRLGKLARIMRWSEREALGSLVLMWGRTQDAEIITAPRSRIHTIIVIDYDTDAHADEFISACVSAQLISDAEGQLTVRGNKPHVDRLVKLREDAKKGGLAKSAKSSMSSLPQGSLDRALPVPLPCPPRSLLPAPSVHSELDLLFPLAEAAHVEHDSRGGSIPESAPRVSAAVAKPRRQRGERSEAEQRSHALVRDAWRQGYTKRTGRAPIAWGAPENSHLYHLLKTWPAEELARMAFAFHEWPRPEVIKAGYPFMGHGQTFSSKLNELHEDLTNFDRRKTAASVKHQEEQYDFRAQLEAQGELVLQQIAEERHREQLGRIEAGADAERKNLGAGADAALRDPFAQNERRGVAALDEAPNPAGRIGVVPRDGKGV